MPTMKSVHTGAPDAIDVVDLERPAPGPNDVLLRVRACGICGTDVTFLHMGGGPFGPGGEMTAVPLGHEPAGEIVSPGAEATGLKVGDHVVVNPQAAPSGIIGCGGALGGMREYLIIENAVVGKSLALIPDSVPFDVAALNEPLAVALHCFNRSGARPTDKVVVFGAGPIGLGATIWLKLRGVQHVIVADVIPTRLETALAVGADAVIGARQDHHGSLRHHEPARTVAGIRRRPRHSRRRCDIGHGALHRQVGVRRRLRGHHLRRRLRRPRPAGPRRTTRQVGLPEQLDRPLAHRPRPALDRDQRVAPGSVQRRLISKVRVAWVQT